MRGHFAGLPTTVQGAAPISRSTIIVQSVGFYRLGNVLGQNVLGRNHKVAKAIEATLKSVNK
jgi:hypothetical protein